MEKALQAVVTSIEGNGKRKYAVTRLRESPPTDSKLLKSSTVTFSLSEWKGEQEPVNGQLVLLADIVKFVKGWRARSAGPMRA